MNERYESLDVLKALCALLVIFIHIPYTYFCAEYITAIARIAVPIFFMITGFFYEKTFSEGR